MRVVLDACVLYSAPLRDFMMHLSLLDVIEARWTNLIHEEWIRSILRDRPDLDRERLERTRRLMDENTRDSLVTGFEHLIPKLRLPDADDRHVLAAAIHCEADAIITFNLKDFSAKAIRRYGVRVFTPDELLSSLSEEFEEQICLAFRRQLQSLKSPPLRRDDLLQIFSTIGLKRTAKGLRRCA